jgi:predicted dehydrogenase
VTEKLRVGIISANWGAYAHLPAWRTLPDVEVAAICTAHEETARAAAAQHGIAKPYWDYRRMFEDRDLDLIDVGTRPSLRNDMVCAALMAGKHVYNCIPFATGVEPARRMLDLQQSQHRVGAVDAYIQAVPAIVRMKEMVDEGWLGDLFAVTCNFHLGLLNAPPAGFAFKWFADKSNGASALRNLGSHALHTLVHLFGEIDEVVAHAQQNLNEWRFDDGSVMHPQVDDTAMALLRFKRGGVVQLNPCWVAARGSGFFLEAYGSRGRLVARAPGFPEAFNTTLHAAEAGAFHRTGAPETLVELPERLLTVPRSTADARASQQAVFPMASVFRRVVDAAREGGEATPSFAQGVHVEEVLDAAYRSMETRQWVRVQS